MKQYVVYNEDGFIVEVSSMPTTPSYIDNVSNLYILETDQYFDIECSIVKGGEIVPIPKSPGIGYALNTTSLVWEPMPEYLPWFWNKVKEQRNRLLLASDWTQLPDVPLATKEAWAVYRQALRDITNQGDPFNITWPVPPT